MVLACSRYDRAYGRDIVTSDATVKERRVRTARSEAARPAERRAGQWLAYLTEALVDDPAFVVTRSDGTPKPKDEPLAYDDRLSLAKRVFVN